MKELKTYEMYKIKSIKNLKSYLDFEQKQYRKYMYPSLLSYLWGRLKAENTVQIMRWQKLSRLADYYDYAYHIKKKIHIIPFLWYSWRKNRLANKLGLEINTALIGKGLMVYHFNNVINGNVAIGDNCHVHGTVVIGNLGSQDLRCPSIGNNVMIGAGAKVIGNVTIADSIKVAAGAVVVSSFLEPGITIGGIPAKRLK